MAFNPDKEAFNEVLSALRAQGIGKLRSGKLLAKIFGMPTMELVQAVHESEAWADTKELDERATEIFVTGD